MKDIIVCLGFKTQAEEAVNFYVSVFRDSKILKTTHYGKNQPGPEGTVCAIAFMLNGRRYLAFNGNHDMFNFTYGMSLMAECEDQAEIDFLWEKLSEGGKKEECGWVRDQFGLSWQIVPASFSEMMRNADERQAQNLMQAVWSMQKIDIAALEKAYAA
jgi:predicted 3-demethylubiquinone-9 3-methyltransferase (glyoxalase superfamily)